MSYLIFNKLYKIHECFNSPKTVSHMCIGLTEYFLSLAGGLCRRSFLKQGYITIRELEEVLSYHITWNEYIPVHELDLVPSLYMPL